MNIFGRRSSKEVEDNKIITGRSDDDLADYCLAGRKTCCNELFKRHYESILRYFSVRLRRDDLAYERTQDTFAKAFAGLATWKRDAKFSTWLFRIAINLDKDRNRQSFRHCETRHVSLDDENGAWENDASLVNNQDTPEQVFGKKELTSLMNNLIDLLPHEERQVILLRLRADEPCIAEISEITGFSVGKTHQLMHKALKSLGKMLPTTICRA